MGNSSSQSDSDENNSSSKGSSQKHQGRRKRSPKSGSPRGVQIHSRSRTPQLALERGNHRSSVCSDTTGSPSAATSSNHQQRPRSNTMINHHEQQSKEAEGSGTAELHLTLNRSQTRAIQKLWRASHGKGEAFVGSEIFDKIFMKVPQARQLFDSARSKGMRSHYVQFGASLDYVIENLDHSEKTREFLRNLGRRHAAVRSEGFDPKLWNVFGEALIHATLEWDVNMRRNEDIQQAWCNVVLFIIGCMREGYYDTLRRSPLGPKPTKSKSFLTVEDAALDNRRYSFNC